ncbi:MAG: FG-GAP repeat domain-containing protein [Promethearchaeota archaeon]
MLRVFIGDANTDGKNDIICSNYRDDTISILLWNSGTSDWKSQIVLPPGNGPSNPIIKDFNHDGKNDIAAANWDDHDVSLLYWFEDNTPPSITINSPIQDGNYSTAPTFDVVTTDNYYIDKKWYTLNANPTKHFFTSNEPISGWISEPDGLVSIIFYANDTAGNQDSDYVVVNKDNTDPFINILSPVTDEYFEDIAPSYSVEFFDDHLDSMWYTYSYYDPTKYLFTDNGTLSGWTGLPDGNIPIRFYANDTFNNEVYEQVYVIKDTTDPEITIYDPDAYDYYGSDAPYYSIYIDEYTLDTFWYTLNESSNIFITSNWDYINQTLWDSIPSSFVRITFYANDSFSRLSSETVTVIKDIDDPIIQINSPSTNELIGKLGPEFDVSLIEPNLDVIWYSLDNGINNYTLGTWCNYYAWDRCDDGDVTINFYARDMIGNKGSAEIVVRKDSTEPEITINSPIGGQEFSSTPPNFNLSVSELNPDSTWYTFDNEVNCYLCGLIGQIDSGLWNNLDNGEYTIKFYANDTVGNENFATVQISKNEPTDDFLLVIVISAISGGAIIGLASIIWLRKRRK